MRGLPSLLCVFRNKFNKFKSTRARLLDSIYHITLKGTATVTVTVLCMKDLNKP